MTQSKKIWLGATVRWQSQAGGFHKVKEGEVVAVIPAGMRPDRDTFLDLHRGNGCGWPRDHDSFVVRVGKKHYWPRVSALRLSEVS